jgi:glutamate synthase domain-containing protein 2
MGVATFGAYLGAHLVETIGLRASLTFQYFRDVPAVPGSVTLEDLIATILERHRAAIADAPAATAPPDSIASAGTASSTRSIPTSCARSIARRLAAWTRTSSLPPSSTSGRP